MQHGEFAGQSLTGRQALFTAGAFFLFLSIKYPKHRFTSLRQITSLHSTG